MKTDRLIRDPIVQLNLLLWMAKEQPAAGYVVRPLFFEHGFGVLYIENPFPLPHETLSAIQKSGRDISTSPEPELLLGRMSDKKALTFEAKADSFSPASSACRQARGHLLAVGTAFAEVMTPYQTCLLCYVIPEDRRGLMSACLSNLVADLAGCALEPGSHSCHGLAVVGQEIHYSWDDAFQNHAGVSGTSAVVLSGLADDTDPSPLLLIYTDEDYPDAERRDLLRRCALNQVHALLVCDLHRGRIDEPYECSAEAALLEMTDGLYRFLSKKRQKAMRRLVAENVFRRIADYCKERFPGVTADGEVLKAVFADEQAKASFLDWLEDFKRTAFQAKKPPEEERSLFDTLDQDAADGLGVK